MRGGVPPRSDVCSWCGAYDRNRLQEIFFATEFSKTPCIIVTFVGVKKKFP